MNDYINEPSEVKEKVQAELVELHTRTSKLSEFIESEDFAKVNSTQQTLLALQFKAMDMYLAVLTLRFNNLTTES